MPLFRLLPWLLTAIIASVAGEVSAIQAGHLLLSWASILMFVAALVATSIEVNRPWWTSEARNAPDAATYAALHNTHLLSVAYTWGALAMYGVYRLSGLRWQHGWQYAAGMALIAGLLMLYVSLMERPASRLRRPAALAFAAQCGLLHAAAAIAGLVFLVLSGKLVSTKGDWAANQIFLGGCVAIVALTAIAAYTQYRLAGPSSRSNRSLSLDQDRRA
jgi:hypothetical protein